MKRLTLPLTVVLVALAVFFCAATPADAQEDFVIVVTGNGATAQAAIADAFEKAAQFAPYEIIGQTVEPLCEGWICVLELVQIG